MKNKKLTLPKVEHQSAYFHKVSVCLYDIKFHLCRSCGLHATVLDIEPAPDIKSLRRYNFGLGRTPVLNAGGS